MALRIKLSLARLRWILLAPIPLIWCFAAKDQGVSARDGALTFLENKLIDWRFRSRGPIDAPIKVVYVDVDSRSIDEIGGWPWNRARIALVAKTLLDRAGVKAIGMDFVFSDNGLPETIDHEKLIEGNRALGAFLWRTPSVVVAASYSARRFRSDIDHKLKLRELPVVARGLGPLDRIEPPEQASFNVGRSAPFSPPGVGIIDTWDLGTRWVPLWTPSAERTFYHLAVELARLYYGVDRSGLKVEGDDLLFIRPNGTVAARVPMFERQSLEVNWFSPWHDAERNPRIPFSVANAYVDMLSSKDPRERKTGEAFFAQPEFKGSIVLIGPVDPLMQDLAATPMDDDPVPKVGIHGNLLKTIVSGKYLRRVSQNTYYLLIIGLTALATAPALIGGRGRWAKARSIGSKIASTCSVAGYVAVAFTVFRTHDLILPIAAPIGSALTASFVAMILQVVDEQKQKGRIKGLFGAYVAPALVERMVSSGEEPRLGGIEENITAYFSDIQSFSTFSEQLSPHLLVELMNEYLTACTDIVQAEGGTLDKYIGDAVVAMYGAPLVLPDHAHRACVASLRVHRRSVELREKWRSEEGKWPEIVTKLQTRIGLNSGTVVVGNMGSHTRFNYTMMGDNVNLAARMESGAKSWGVYSMCTDSTKAGCEKVDPTRVLFRALGRIVVMGRTQPVPIYEVVALREDLTDGVRECVGLFEQGLARFLERDWAGAEALFRRSAALEPNQPGVTVGVKTNPSLLYLADVAACVAKPPPAGWNGVKVMKEK